MRIILAALALAGCATHPAAEPIALDRLAPLGDQCLAQPGYPAFRAALSAAVARRDTAAFLALFAAEGGMRVNGVSRDRASWSRAEAAGVWRELDDILALGCAAEAGRLYLPAIGALAERGEVNDETDIALANTALRQRADATAPMLRRIARGEIVQRINYDTPPGWNEVQAGTASGFIPRGDLRSTHGFMLVLVEDGTNWKIREFTGGV